METEYPICLHLLHRSDHICTPWALFLEGAHGLERQLAGVVRMSLRQYPRRPPSHCRHRYRRQEDLPFRREQSSVIPCRCSDTSYANNQDIDIEAAATSNESACLVTPIADDTMDHQSLGYGAVGYGHVRKHELSVR